MNSQIPVRNYAVMNRELSELQAQFKQGNITENEYCVRKAQIEQDIFEYKYKKPFLTEMKIYIKEHRAAFLRNLLNSFATLFAVLSLAFSILPLENFGLAAAVIAAVLAMLSLLVSKQLKIRCYARYLAFAVVAIMIFATIKIIFSKDEVSADTQFEEVQKQSELEVLDELEASEQK